MKSVCFFGSKVSVLESIDDSISIIEVVVERRAINRELVDYCVLKNVKLLTVYNKDSLCDVIQSLESDLGVSCGFGLIFTRDHINYFLDGIINIHYGELPNYRGRHALSWSLLKNNWKIGVSIHLVDEKIDVGNLLHQFFVKRYTTDNLHSIENRIEQALNREFAIALDNLVAGYHVKLPEGRYFESLQGKFEDFDPKQHDAIYILNAFRSQEIYGGIKINGVRFTKCSVFHTDIDWENWTKIICKDGIALMLW